MNLLRRIKARAKLVLRTQAARVHFFLFDHTPDALDRRMELLMDMMRARQKNEVTPLQVPWADEHPLSRMDPGPEEF